MTSNIRAKLTGQLQIGRQMRGVRSVAETRILLSPTSAARAMAKSGLARMIGGGTSPLASVSSSSTMRPASKRYARKIARSVHEAARDKARAIAKTEAYAVSRRQRKKVEMLFAHLKRILRLDRLRLRGPSRSQR